MPTTTLALSRPPLISWFAVTSLTLGIFAIVTSETLPHRPAHHHRRAFGSNGIAGLTMTLPSIIAARAAPPSPWPPPAWTAA